MNETNRAETSTAAIGPGRGLAAGMLREIESWSSAQCELLSGIGTIWSDWLRRQREAIDASSRTLQQMYECRNVADLMRLQQQWLADIRAARRCRCQQPGERVGGADLADRRGRPDRRAGPIGGADPGPTKG